jgi:hypothetical protein
VAKRKAESARAHRGPPHLSPLLLLLLPTRLHHPDQPLLALLKVQGAP